MIELPERHLRTDVLAHCHECYGEHGEGLEGIILLTSALLFASLLRLLDVVIAVMEHCLNLKDVAGASERATVDKNLGLSGNSVWNRLQRFKSSVRRVLSACSIKRG